ncbi:MAG TPA: diguanylate cyclase [Chromatiaceae bacterium]|nr:diguanylate cyclase [Chromatiaceae bacterium]
MMPAAAKILIVDDHPLAIEVLRNALVDLGQFRMAAGGAAALALVEKEPVDLILLDGRMPIMDGFTTCRMLQREFPEIPVIIVTIMKDDVSEIRALDAGAVDFITKPINPVVVRARVATHLKLKAQSDLLRSLSSRDPLTGIPNRRTLEERLAGEWRRSQRHGLPLSLVMIDIDHFKAYNDHYGHLQGDECLRQVAQCIAGSLTRGEDLVARYGGEEFAALLGDASLEVALASAEKIRANVRSLAIPQAPGLPAPYVSLSMGVAMSQPSPPPQELASSLVRPRPRRRSGDSGWQPAIDLIERADRALYRAKAAGRDCVRVDDWGAVAPLEARV